MRSRVLILGVVLAVLVIGAAGCGGDDDESGGAATTAETTTEAGDDGAAVFASAGCGDCHALAAAGSSGTSGPNLDELMPDKETVEEQVRNGGGAMPAFEGQLSDAEIEAVAAYVAESAGS